MADKLMTHEETLALINAKAKADGDSFLLKVFRKKFAGGLPESLASFSDVQTIHIHNPEHWLPKFAGGGPLFVFYVYHVSEPTTAIGGPLTIQVPTDSLQAKAVGELDPRIVKSRDWKGPSTLIWPTAEDLRKNEIPYAISALPPGPGIGNSVANVSVPVPGAQGVGRISAEEEKLQRLTSQLETERFKLEQNQRQFEDDKRRMELDNIRRENDARAKDLESRITAELRAIAQATQTAQAVPRGPDLTQTIATVLAAITPMVQTMMTANNEMRLAQMKQQEQAQAQTQAILTSILARPSVDPAIEKAFDKIQSVLERSQATQVPQTQVLHSMTEAMASMTGMTMDFMQAAADNIGGGKPDDHPMLKAVKEGVKAVTQMMAGYQAALPGGAQAPQQRRPAPPPQQHPGLPAHQGPPQNVAAWPQGQIPHGPGPRQQIIGIPEAAPAPQLHTVQPPVPLPERTQFASVFDYLIELVKHQAPAAYVASEFIKALAEPEMITALSEVDNEVEELVSRRFGGFIMANPDFQHYLGEILKELNAQGTAAGLFHADGPDDEDTEDEEQDEEEEGEEDGEGAEA